MATVWQSLLQVQMKRQEPQARQLLADWEKFHGGSENVGIDGTEGRFSGMARTQLETQTLPTISGLGASVFTYTYDTATALVKGAKFADAR